MEDSDLSLGNRHFCMLFFVPISSGHPLSYRNPESVVLNISIIQV